MVFGKSGLHWPAPGYIVPAVAGLVGALLVAGEVVLIRTLAVRDSASTVLLHVNGWACLFLALPVAWAWQPVTVPQALQLAALGPLAIAGQYFNIQAFRRAPASLLGPVGYSRLLFAAGLGFLLFAEVPDSGTWLGGAVLIVSGWVLTRSHAR
ncbi:MAG: DMT family transporter [Xenophilus sp.]